MGDTEVKEVRLGRNFLRVGDACKVKLAGKTQFTSGWTVVAFEDAEHARVRRDGRWRIVGLDGIRRVAQTRAGQRIER